MNKFINFIKLIYLRILRYNIKLKINDLNSKMKLEKSSEYDKILNDLRKNGFYIIEDYKFPNYFKHLDDIQHDKLDVVMNNLKNKKIFNSKIFDESFQRKLHNSIKKISLHQGNSEYSNIAFIQKNVQF